MIDWFRFVFGNKRLLNFGFLFNFFSSFGQTFFISLFVPYWVETFQISNAAFGSIYAIVTIISALLLSLSGRFIDHMPLKKFGSIVFTGLMVSTVLLALAENVIFLIIGILMVRLFGQGLMTHTSSTGIARHFEKDRGKALGFTALGHPAGQFFLPFLVLPLLTTAGWRLALIYLSVGALIIVTPGLWAISPTRGFTPNFSFLKTKAISNGPNYLHSMKFWIIASNIFIIPFLCTAIFLYQYTIGKDKGWDGSWVAFSFSFYAIFNAVALLLSGSLIDKFTGIRLFPLYLIPALAALVLILIFEDKWVFPVFYSLLGFSTGLGSTIKTAIQVEIYGTSNLGKIRGYFGAILVISTSLGPPVFGFFLDKQFSLNSIFGITGIFLVLIILLSNLIRKKDT